MEPQVTVAPTWRINHGTDTIKKSQGKPERMGD